MNFTKSRVEVNAALALLFPTRRYFVNITFIHTEDKAAVSTQPQLTTSLNLTQDPSCRLLPIPSNLCLSNQFNGTIK